MIKSKRNFLAALLGTAVMVPTFKFPTPANVYDHLKCCWSWYKTKEILNAMPVRKNGIASREETSFTILSDSRRQDLIRLNQAAARIWHLCDGRNSVDAMVRTMTGDYDVSPSACATDVILALTVLKRKGLISC
jgi:hypothetical protein